MGHNRDYKGTAEKYDVSYSQVYSWVKKYDGNDGLNGGGDGIKRRKKSMNWKNSAGKTDD